MPRKLDDFMAELERETRLERPKALAESEILRAHYEFASRIYLARQQYGLTQLALARASGIDQAEISRIGRGHSNPTMATMVELLTALGLRLDYASREAHPRGSGSKTRQVARYGRRGRKPKP